MTKRPAMMKRPSGPAETATEEEYQEQPVPQTQTTEDDETDDAEHDDCQLDETKSKQEDDEDDGAGEIKGKNAADRKRTLKIIKDLNLQLSTDGTLKQRLQDYCRIMSEQPVDVLKKVHLPTSFAPKEMSALWQLLKGWIKKSSPNMKQKWKAIQEMKGDHNG